MKWMTDPTTRSGKKSCRLTASAVVTLWAAISLAGTVEAPRNLETSALPCCMLFLDMDGDGDLDLAIAENPPLSSAQLELFENPGNGLFVPRGFVALPCSSQPVCGDFNGDGRLDLAQGRGLGNTAGELHTWIQTGPFAFQERTLPLPFAARSVYVGNLDGQLGVDLIIPDDLLGLRAFIYLAQADGGFAPGGEVDTEAIDRDSNGDLIVEHNLMINSRHCVAADLNGDGLDDLLASHSLERLEMPDAHLSTLTLRLNLGAGRFGPLQVVLDPSSTPSMGVPAFEGSMAVGDVDGDGDLDLVALSGADLVVCRNDGTGGFGPGSPFPSGAVNRLPTAPELVDADGDGDLDVTIPLAGMIAGAPTDLPTDRWVLLRNDGLGAFGPAELYPTGAGLAQVALVNVDGVAGPEAIALAADDHRFSINPNRAGQFHAPRTFSIQHPDSVGPGKQGTVPMDVVSGDFNGDRRPDLAITAGINPLPGLTPETLIFLDGGGGGLGNPPYFLPLPGGANRVAVCRWSGSPATDLIVAHAGHRLTGLSDGLSLVRSGAGAWPAGSAFLATDSTPTDVAGIELEGTRCAAALRYGLAGGTARILVAAVNADGSLTGLGDLFLGNDDPLAGDLRFPQVLAVEDMNRDGRVDLVAVTANVFRPSPAVLSVVCHDGTLHFSLSEYPACRGTAVDLLLADLNDDGRPDAILVWQADSTAAEREGGVDVMLQLPSGAMAAPVTYRAGTGPTGAAVAELDGRPGLDIAVACDGSNELTILLNDGQGRFPTQERYLTGGGTDGLAIGDFDGDGWPDIAVVHDDDDLETPVRHNPTVTILRGLNPNALPIPRMALPRWVGNDLLFRLENLAGPARYTIERSPHLSPPAWTPVATLPGTTTEWRTTPTGPQGFYRLAGQR